MQKVMKWCAIVLGFAMAAAGGFAYGCLIKDEPSSPFMHSENKMETDPLEMFKTQRQQTRQMQIAQLNEIMHSSNTDSEMIVLAQKQLMEILNDTESEEIIEDLLRIRGFEDLIVSVHKEAASVFLRGENISEQQTAIILECITREAEISAGNVKIIPIN